MFRVDVYSVLIMQDFSRILWVSQRAKDLWLPRIRKIHEDVVSAELKSVYTGYRKATLQIDSWPVNPEGFVTIGLGTQISSSSYLDRTPSPQVGERFSVRTVTTYPSLVDKFIKAYKDHDDELIGHLLGYPNCCIDFFVKNWKQDVFDLIERMDISYPCPNQFSNVLLHWLGVRPVPHMPCSLACQETLIQGQYYANLLPSQERDWLKELLSMSIKYSTLHGIAEITTPLFKLAVSSQGQREFHLIGSAPDGTVGGLKFPFVEDIWTNNGFVGPQSMKDAHETILRIFPKAERIIDFGCGNGELLSKLEASVRIGIDINIAAIIQARKLQSFNFIIGNIFEIPVPEHDLSLVSLERLTESSDPQAFIEKLADKVIIYTYSDGCSQFEERKKRYFSEWTTLQEVVEPSACAALIWR